MNIEYKEKKLYLDGKPRTLLFAEFHYFRTDPEFWQEKIDLIKEAGCHGIASYIPWLMHEEFEGDFDFTGRRDPRLDLIGFIELIEKNNLFFIPRPGPFIMAEMKNEGLPFWIYKRYPEIIPTTWDNQVRTTMTVDYLAPNFLRSAKAYYQQVVPILAQHQYPAGSVIAMQLDNEIGMLSWVSNNPDLTDFVINDFVRYLQEKHGDNGVLRYPFLSSDEETIKKGIRSPQKAYLDYLHYDLGLYSRERYSRYVDTLKAYAEEFGFDKGLFIINIHGCSAGRALLYPIGLSQLYQTYRNKDRIISGSDVYLNAIDVPTFTDSYMANLLTASTNGPEQPLTSLEFSAGDGDYGNSLASRAPTSRIDFMTRMFILTNNRLLSYYTFVGGTNGRFHYSLEDGNDRIAITGEEHGFAAPISPNGKKSYTFERNKEVIQLMRQHADFLADQFLVTDDIEFGFIPDYYMTEYHYPKLSKEIHANIEMHRDREMWDTTLKSLLLRNYIFQVRNIQDEDIQTGKVLLIASARYMSSDIQVKIIQFLKSGGRLILQGEVPLYDLEGKPCRLLLEYLELKPKSQNRWRGYHYQSSIVAQNIASGRKELHREYYCTYDYNQPEDIFLKVYHTGEGCGFHIKKDGGEAFVITCQYRADLELFERFMNHFGVKRHLHHHYTLYHGIFMAKTTNSSGCSYLHMMNMDDFDKQFDVIQEGLQPLSIYMEENTGLLLPQNLVISDQLTVLSTTNEIIAFSDNELVFRLNGPSFICEVKTALIPQSDDSMVTIEKTAGGYGISKSQRIFGEKETHVRFD